VERCIGSYPCHLESVEQEVDNLFAAFGDQGCEIDYRIGNSTDGLSFINNFYDLRMNVIPPLSFRFVILFVRFFELLGTSLFDVFEGHEQAYIKNVSGTTADILQVRDPCWNET